MPLNWPLVPGNCLSRPNLMSAGHWDPAEQRPSEPKQVEAVRAGSPRARPNLTHAGHESFRSHPAEQRTDEGKLRPACYYFKRRND